MTNKGNHTVVAKTIEVLKYDGQWRAVMHFKDAAEYPPVLLFSRKRKRDVMMMSIGVAHFLGELNQHQGFPLEIINKNSKGKIIAKNSYGHDSPDIKG